MYCPHVTFVCVETYVVAHSIVPSVGWSWHHSHNTLNNVDWMCIQAWHWLSPVLGIAKCLMFIKLSVVLGIMYTWISTSYNHWAGMNKESPRTPWVNPMPKPTMFHIYGFLTVYRNTNQVLIGRYLFHQAYGLVSILCDLVGSIKRSALSEWV